jgi:electron transfer flavoprotein beta subunit
MSNSYQIVVCAGIVPDPLQTLEPITTPAGPGLKNEMMLPAVLDPWAGHALYEAANLATKAAGTKLWLVSASPKAKLQQVMMNVAQKAAFELVPVDVPANGFADAHTVAALLGGAIQSIAGLDRSKLLLFGGWESASRGAGVTMQLVAEQLGILDQFHRSPTGRLRSWNESKAGATWFQNARGRRCCWDGRRAICPNRKITLNSGWRTCVP